MPLGFRLHRGAARLRGEIDSVHAFANKGGLTDGYPIQDNFFLNLHFASGAIGRVSGLYGIVHPPMPNPHNISWDQGSAAAGQITARGAFLDR